MSLAVSRRRPPISLAGANNTHAVKGRFAMVVSTSAVNGIVVSRILQDCGIRPVAVDASVAANLLKTCCPLLIIIEASHNPLVLAPLLLQLSQCSAPEGAPPAIYLAGSNEADLPDYPFGGIAKMPVTMETIRPLIERYL